MWQSFLNTPCTRRLGWQGLRAHSLRWERSIQNLISQVIPCQCLICHSQQNQSICPACEARFARPILRCSTCAIDLPTTTPSHVTQCMPCLRTAQPLTLCVAAVDFAYPWSGLVAKFKFSEQPSLARALIEVMKSAPGAEQLIANTEWVLPMPLTPERLKQRGYNQAWELARRLADLPSEPHNLKADAHVLLRVRDTPSQRGLTRQERHHNVKGAFMVAPEQATRLHGQRVLLVDDVMTTGASIFEAAHTLRQAGAAQVSALVFARTPLDQH